MHWLRKWSVIKISNSYTNVLTSMLHAVLQNTNPALRFTLITVIERFCVTSFTSVTGMIGYFPLDATEPLLANDSGADSILKASGHDISTDYRRQNNQVTCYKGFSTV